VQNNQFVALCNAIGRPELASSARFSTPEQRASGENAQFLREVLTAVLAPRDAADWEKELNQQGVPCGRVRDIGEVCDQATLADRQLLLPTDIPGAPASGVTPRYVNAGFVFGHDGPGCTGAAPRLGEHSSEILRDLGYSAAEIERLLADLIVRSTSAQG
jgi:formyl-CoA transferase